jgi:hypothetical protein
MKKPTTLAITGLSLSLLIVGLVFVPSNAHAQAASTGSGQALEIGPPVVNLSVDPGKTVTAQISLRDVSGTPLLVTGQINDFIAEGEDGTPKILLDGTTSPYSFKAWVAPLTSLTLQPKQIKTLTVTINVPANASPGGYYGVVRFTGTPPGLNGTGVSLAASLGSLVLLTVNGQAKESMSIAEFSANNGGKAMTLFQSAPINFIQRLKNSGNIQEEPTGLVTITDMFNKTVATLPINEPPGNVLPSSIRKFSVPLDSTVIGNRILFGLYHADLTVTYGADKQTLTSSFTFWVIPYTLIIVVVVALVVAFLVLRFLIRRYNRLIIARAGKSHKK